MEPDFPEKILITESETGTVEMVVARPPGRSRPDDVANKTFSEATLRRDKCLFGKLGQVQSCKIAYRSVSLKIQKIEKKM